MHNILYTIPHNPHYLNRYAKFIAATKQPTRSKNVTEAHHICPKGLFPEFTNLTKHKWNVAHLTYRQHFIAHWLLWKAFPQQFSLAYAFCAMHTQFNQFQNRKQHKQSRAYAIAKQQASEHMSGTRRGVPLTPEHIDKLKAVQSTLAARENNSWRQIRDLPSLSRYTSITELDDAVKRCAQEYCSNPTLISQKLSITRDIAKTSLLRLGLTIITDANYIKLLNKYGKRFSSYEDYARQIIDAHNQGMCVYQIAQYMNISPNGIKPVLLKNNIIPHKGVTGPRVGQEYTQSPGISKNTHRWYSNDELQLSKRSSTPIDGWYLGRKFKTST